MKNVKTIIVILMVVSIVAGIISVATMEHQGTVYQRTYEGRLYLDEDEYEEFKMFLFENPDIKIQKMDVLSSTNVLVDMVLVDMVLVDMVLVAPDPILVPYAVEETEHISDDFPLSVLLILIPAGVLAGYIVVYWGGI